MHRCLAPPRWRGLVARDGFVALALFAVCTGVYLADERWIGCGDTAATVLLARSIAFHGDFSLDEFFPSSAEPLPYYARREGEHVYSWFPLGSALLAVPAFAAARASGVAESQTLDARVELFTASWVAAAAVSAAYLLLRRFAGRRWSLVLALLFAFGSPNWSTSSMNLWQHGPGTLAVELGVLALLDATTTGSPRSSVLAGAALGFAVLVRPLNALFAAAFAVPLVLRDRRALLRYLLGAAPWGAVQLFYGYATFGSMLGGYAHAESARMWQGPVVEAALAHLVSPNRGLFAASPFLVVGLFGLPALSRRMGGLVYPWLVAAVLQLVAISAYASWWDGWCFGPRYMTEVVPLALLGLAPLEDVLRASWIWRAGFAVLAAFSVAFHAVGVRSDAARTWNAMPSIDTFPGRVWDLRESQVLAFRRYRLRSFPCSVPVSWLDHQVGADEWAQAAPAAFRQHKLRWLWLETRGDPRELVRWAPPGVQGWLASGTSFDLPAGEYRLSLDVAGVADASKAPLGRADLVVDGGHRVLFGRAFTAASLGQGRVVLHARLARATLVEPRLWWSGSTSARVEVRSLTVERVRHRSEPAPSPLHE